MNEVVDALNRVYNTLESGFCQGTLAKDEFGVTVDPESPLAVKWCILGAIGIATDDRNMRLMLGQLITEQTVTSMSLFNDTHKKKEVLEVVDAARRKFAQQD